MMKPEFTKVGAPKRLEEGRGQSQDRVIVLQHALGEAVRENEMLLERIMLLQALIVAAQMRDDEWGRQLASLEESESLDSLSAYSQQIRKKPYPKRKAIKGVRRLDQNVDNEQERQRDKQWSTQTDKIHVSKFINPICDNWANHISTYYRPKALVKNPSVSRSRILLQNNYIYKMDHGKDKTIAYGRFGKTNSKIQKDVPIGRGQPRKSHGNIYDDIVEQMDPVHKKYVKQLVRRNQVNPLTPSLNREDTPFFTGKIETPIIQTNLQQSNFQQKLNREKGNNPIQFITPSQPRKQEQTQQKVGVFKPSFQREYFSYQVTPKNHSQNKGFTKLEEREEVDAFGDRLNEFAVDDVKYERKQVDMCRSFKSEENFLQNLDSYMGFLKMKTSESETNGRKKLNNTIKFSEENCKLASRLEASVMKIKELKLKNHLLEKQQGRQARKQQKMKSSIYQMMAEIRYLNESLAKEKKEKRNLQKIINNFEANVRRCKPERKTIGKGIKQMISDDFDSRIYHQVTENDSEMQDLNEISEFNSSYQWRSRNKIGKNPFQDKHDEQKTDQLFDYHDGSQDGSQND